MYNVKLFAVRVTWAPAALLNISLVHIITYIYINKALCKAVIVNSDVALSNRSKCKLAVK